MFDTISFITSKFFWAMLAPSHFLVLLLVLSLLIGNQFLRRSLQTPVVMVLFATMIFPVGEWLAQPLESCFANVGPPMQKVDGVVVLGGAVDGRLTMERNAIEFNASAGRITGLMKLMKDNPDMSIIYSGGPGEVQYQDFNEAAWVKNFLDSMGMDTSHYKGEGASRNTYENALNTLKIINQGQEKNWYLLSSAIHLPRAMALFEKQGAASGIKFFPYVVSYRTVGSIKFEANFDLPANLRLLDFVAREYLGLYLNKLMGKTDTAWPCTREPKTLS